MENQHHSDAGSVIAVPNQILEENSNRHQPQRVSRFSIQRLDTSDMMMVNMPRRRASVNHGQQSAANRSEFNASSYITVDEINVSQPARPPVGVGIGSIREHSKGFVYFLPTLLVCS